MRVKLRAGDVRAGEVAPDRRAGDLAVIGECVERTLAWATTALIALCVGALAALAAVA